MTGTSVDGLDIALVDIQDERIVSRAAATIDLPSELRGALLELGQPERKDDVDAIDRLGYCDAALGDFIGEALLEFLSASSIPSSSVRAIGSHGQTVRHRPDGSAGPPFTLQIGDPNRIAERTGIDTVADFRRRDMAAGGQGAPLVPPFHAALFKHVSERPVGLNIGGISNISVLAPHLYGFDTGPGNCLLDEWCARHTGSNYDQDGAWATTGTAHAALLSSMLDDPYFELAPPKSTGREYFNRAWLDRILSETNAVIEPVDVQATLIELTARSIVAALPADTDHVIACGGGRLNARLMERLDALCSAELSPSERFGVDGDSVEAAAFAWLASETLAGRSGNAPAVTGAAGERVLGSIFPG